MFWYLLSASNCTSCFPYMNSFTTNLHGGSRFKIKKLKTGEALNFRTVVRSRTRFHIHIFYDFKSHLLYAVFVCLLYALMAFVHRGVGQRTTSRVQCTALRSHDRAYEAPSPRPFQSLQSTAGSFLPPATPHHHPCPPFQLQLFVDWWSHSKT